MNKTEIVGFIKKNKSVQIAELQKAYNITYDEAKSVISEMLNDGRLVYSGGVRYDYVGKQESSKSDVGQKRAEAICKIRGESEYGAKVNSRMRAYFEMRRKLAEEEEDDDEIDESDDDEIDEDVLRYRALRLCVENGQASVSLLQRTFPIGYIRACKLVEWMENEGYITPANGPWAREILITPEELETKFSPLDSCRDEYAKKDDDKVERVYKSLKQYFEERSKLSEENSQSSNEDNGDFKAQAQRLAKAVNLIKEKKSAPITKDVLPLHPSWTDEKEFGDAVEARVKQFILLNPKMGREDIIEKIEICLEGVRDTHDRKMVQVYERLVFELKNTSDDLYEIFKKQYLN